VIKATELFGNDPSESPAKTMNKSKLYKLLFVIIVFSLCGVSHAQVLSSEQIDALVERSMKAFDVPGISVGVIKDGNIVYAKGHGVRSLNTKQPMDENTLVGIASNSKAFTTAALGILVDEGKIKWDDKVRDYIPEFKLYAPFVTEEFTIRDLLTHRSGLGLGAGDLMFFPDGSDFTLKDVIHNLRYLKPVSSFRTKYDYDNNLYIVAGEVIARVSGKSWPEFIEERIIRPLGMSSTAATYARLKDKSNTIEGHAPVNGKVQVIERSKLEIAAAAGGVNSNITDLFKWVGTLLAKGKYGEGGSKRLISEASLKELWTPQTIIRVGDPGPYNTHFSAYGLGFGLTDVSGRLQVRHTGGLEGMVTEITMIPELNLGIIVLTNQQEGGAFVSISNQIKDGYLGRTGTDWVSMLSERRKKALADAKVTTDAIWKNIDAAQKAASNVDVAPFVGNYSDAWLGSVSIAMKDGKLWFQSKRSPRLSGEMFAYKGNTFVVKWTDRSMDADAFANFTLNEEGKPSGFTMRAISPLTDFSYDFHDLDFHRLTK
jgi:CubicO group peptidase (beta-lactamase class C family)